MIVQVSLFPFRDQLNVALLNARYPWQAQLTDTHVFTATGTILLCNGCGIRWRRVSGPEGRRIRPGPKSTAAGVPLNAQVGTGSPFKPGQERGSGALSNSSLCTPPKKSRKHHARTERVEPNSKMALKHLLCDTTEGSDRDNSGYSTARHWHHARSARSGPMRINDLIDGNGSAGGRATVAEGAPFVLPPSVRWR